MVQLSVWLRRTLCPGIGVVAILALADCAEPSRTKARPAAPTLASLPSGPSPLSTCPSAQGAAIPPGTNASNAAGPAPTKAAETPPQTPRISYDVDAYLQTAAQLEERLTSGVLAAWYPRLVDKKHGGFGPHVNFDFSAQSDNSKFLVFQSRMTWVAAEVAMRYPARRAEYLPYAQHGLAVLSGKMWDPKNGGLFWETDEDGRPLTTEKHAYGMAFAMYASAAVARATGDGRALGLAMKIFDWLEAHAHDDAHGGYYEALTREGKPVLVARDPTSIDGIGTIYGRKSMNTHIHLLEALTELQRACGGDQVKKRLTEVFLLVRDRIAHPDGFLTLFFTPDWRPIPDDDSYGHDVETAYLLTEAAEVLGMSADPTTRAVARRLVDHALELGWDHEHGGFYDKGPPGGKATAREKIWWIQAEGLNGLLLMHELYGSQTDRYYRSFLKQWSFIDQHVVDRKNGDWYATLDAEGTHQDAHEEKGGKWKDPYHQGRALMECAERLHRLAERGAKR